MQIVYKRILAIAIVASALFAASCNGKRSTEANEATDTAAAAKEEATPPKEETLELTRAQIEAVGIEFGTLELKNLSDVIKATGQLTVPPQSRADVTVLMPGVIRRIYPIEGQTVKKGQLLATIENTELAQIQQDYVTAKNAFSFTAAELKRQKELDEANAGVKKKLQEAQANYNSELAGMRAMENRMKQLGINPAAVAGGNIINRMNVYAPIGGTVGHINVNTGAYAEGGKSLMEITNTSKMQCELTVFEKDIFKVKVGQKVSFVLNSQNNREVTGRIYGINKSFEGETKGVIAHAVIEKGNTYGLVPGMIVNALIIVGSEKVPAVPVDAIVRSEEKTLVFVADKNKKEEPAEPKGNKNSNTNDNAAGEETIPFKMVEVITGVSELGYVKVTLLGENIDKPKIVVKGAHYLLSKSKGSEEEE